MRRAGICRKCGGEAAAQPAALFCCLGQVGQLGQVDGWRAGHRGQVGTLALKYAWMANLGEKLVFTQLKLFPSAIITWTLIGHNQIAGSSSASNWRKFAEFFMATISPGVASG